jgi:hypothetical protein
MNRPGHNAMPECSFLCEEARAYLALDAPLPHGIGILAVVRYCRKPSCGFSVHGSTS